MESALMLITISAGLLLSLAIAMLVEELIFGGIFRLFFAPRPASPEMQNLKTGRKH